ncbi:MAG: hypothetical protein FWD53_05645 [Phycisphaerales bacterium]|nr:hypothetical protein [Phycisphaerales bacterium]
MMKRCGIVLGLVLVMAVVVGLAGERVWGQEASTPPKPAVKLAIGTKVEVKDGNRWGTATITNTRGEWYLVTYERAGLKEWVEPWRIRKVGSTEDNVGIAMPNRKMSGMSKQIDPPPQEKPGSAPAPGKIGVTSRERSSGPAQEPVLGKPPNASGGWDVGTKVEIKRGTRWEGATITNTRGEWYLVTRDSGGWREWVEPWRIRQVGSTEDNLGRVSSNSTMSRLSKQLDPPPREKPGLPPRQLARGFPTDKKEGGVTSAKEKELWSDALDQAWEGRSAWRYQPLAEVSAADEEGSGGVGRGLGGAMNVRATAPDSSGRFVRSGRATLSLAPTRGPKMMIWIGQLHSRGPSSARDSQVERVDISSRVRSAHFELESGRILLDGSPDGQSILVKVEETMHGEGGKLEVWTLAGEKKDKLERTAEFEPFSEHVTWAWFVDDSRIIVFGQTVAGLLDMTNKKGQWLAIRALVDRTIMPTITRDGKYVAFGTSLGGQAGIMGMVTGGEPGVMLVETATGDEVGFLPRKSKSATLQFSPSGKQLVASSDSGIEVWDMVEGKRWRTLCVDQMPAKSHVVVPKDGYVLLNGEYLVDLERRAVVWKYDQRITEGLVTAEGFYRSLKDGKLSSRIIAAEREISAGKRIKAEDFWIIGPGMTIAIEVSVSGGASQRTTIRDRLAKSCEEAGLRVVDASASPALKLTARTSTGKSETTTYELRPFGSPHFGRPQNAQTQTATATEQISELILEAGGKKLWERRSSYMPSASPVIILKQGETAQQAMDGRNQPDMGLFFTAWIPEYWITTASVDKAEGSKVGK